MERLTYWNGEYGCWSYRCASGNAAKRLAAYEDTGLAPEQINAQQQEIGDLKQNLKIQEAITMREMGKVTALTADKDEQAGNPMRLEEGLKKQRNFLQLLNELGGLGYQKHGWIKSHIAEIDALLGIKEDKA